MKLLFLEFYKVQRQKIWYMLAGLWLAQLGWSLWAMQSYMAKGYQELWPYILLQISQINCLVMPIFIAILASRLCDMEHKGQTFRILHTLVEPRNSYVAKYFCNAFFILLAAAGQALSMTLVGILWHFPGSIPLFHILAFFTTTSLVSLCLLALQQALSLLIPNQMISLVAGVIGGFLGLMALFFPPAIQKCFPWSYYTGLSTIQSTYDLLNKTLHLQYTSLDLPAALCILVIALFLFYIGQKIFQEKEV